MFLAILCTWQQFLCIQPCPLLATAVPGRHYYTSLADEMTKISEMKDFSIDNLYLFCSLSECSPQEEYRCLSNM